MCGIRKCCTQPAPEAPEVVGAAELVAEQHQRAAFAVIGLQAQRHPAAPGSSRDGAAGSDQSVGAPDRHLPRFAQLNAYPGSAPSRKYHERECGCGHRRNGWLQRYRRDQRGRANKKGRVAATRPLKFDPGKSGGTVHARNDAPTAG